MVNSSMNLVLAPNESFLWFIKETDKARYYSKLPPERNPADSDKVWIPRSLCKHTTKYPNGQHIVDVEDWFGDRNNL